MKEEFGNRLFEERKRKGLTQMQLAEKLNTAQSAISSWEKGTAFPNLEIAIEIASLLGVSLDYLCGLDLEKNRITGEQWLSYMDDLLCAPPDIYGTEIIKLDNSKGQETHIVFSGKEMSEFFRAYSAISMIRNIDLDAYQAAKKTLFNKFAKYLRPGVKMRLRGLQVDCPPTTAND